MKKLLFPLILVLVACGKDAYFDGVGIPIRETNRGDYGIASLNGDVLVDFELDAKSSIMVENWAHFNFDDALVFINSEGEEKRTDHQKSLLFNEGHVLVRLKNGKLAILDNTLAIVQTLEGVEEAGSVSEGMFKFLNSDGFWGFMNLEGKEMIKPIYSDVKAFREGLAVVKTYNEEIKERRIGVINTAGKVVIPLTAKYDDLSFFSDGLSVFKEDDQIGYLNTAGEKVIASDTWKEALPFVNGTATVQGSDREFGLIDKQGAYLIKTREKLPIRFFNDLAIFQGSNRKLGFMDKDRNEATRAEYEDMMAFMGNGAFAKDGGEWMYINDEGNDISTYDANIRLLYHEPFTQSVYQNNTAFDLDKTLTSSYVAIDAFYKEALDPSNGFISNITANNKIAIGALDNIAAGLGEELSVLEENPTYSTRIDTYKLLNKHLEFDANLSFSLRFYFGKQVVSKTDNEIVLNPDAVLTSTRVNLRLKNKAYGRGNEMKKEISTFLSKNLASIDDHIFKAPNGTTIKVTNEYSNVYLVYEYPREK